MLRVIRLVSISILLVVTGLAGCVSTQIRSDWRDPTFTGTFKKVLVICVIEDPLVRRTLEDDIAAQFTARGVAAVPSHTVSLSLGNADKEMVRRKVRDIDADGVFIVRPVGHKVVIHEGEVLWGEDVTPDRTLTAEVYRARARLYETVKGQVVWEAISDTFIGGAWMETLNKFAKTMGARLIERKLI